MAFLHEKSANLPTVSNIVPNASEETTEFGLTSPRNAITAITSNVEPCQPSIPNSSASASQQLSVSPNENLTKSNSELNNKDDLLFSSVPGKKVCTSQKRKALAAGMDAEQSLFVSQLNKMDDAIYSCIENNKKKDCEDMLFCKSLVPQLKGLPLKKERLAKIRISQLLFDIDDECD